MLMGWYVQNYLIHVKCAHLLRFNLVDLVKHSCMFLDTPLMISYHSSRFEYIIARILKKDL